MSLEFPPNAHDKSQALNSLIKSKWRTIVSWVTVNCWNMRTSKHLEIWPNKCILLNGDVLFYFASWLFRSSPGTKQSRINSQYNHKLQLHAGHFAHIFCACSLSSMISDPCVLLYDSPFIWFTGRNAKRFEFCNAARSQSFHSCEILISGFPFLMTVNGLCSIKTDDWLIYRKEDTQPDKVLS